MLNTDSDNNSQAKKEFDEYYQRFLAQQSRTPGPESPSSASRSTNVSSKDGSEFEQEFRSHYEQFVGYSVDERLFSVPHSFDYRYGSTSGMFPNSKTFIRNSLMGVGSFAATAVVGSLLISSASNTPKYSFRDYSPELLQQQEFIPNVSTTAEAPIASSGVLSRADSDALEGKDSTLQTEATEAFNIPIPLRPMPNYGVVMPDLSTQRSTQAPTMRVANSSGYLLPSAQEPIAETIPPVTPSVPESPSPVNEVLPSAETSLDTEANVSLPILPIENVGVETAIAFRLFGESSPGTVSPLAEASDLDKANAEKREVVPGLEPLSD